MNLIEELKDYKAGLKVRIDEHAEFTDKGCNHGCEEGYHQGLYEAYKVSLEDLTGRFIKVEM